MMLSENEPTRTKFVRATSCYQLTKVSDAWRLDAAGWREGGLGFCRGTRAPHVFALEGKSGRQVT